MRIHKYLSLLLPALLWLSGCDQSATAVDPVDSQRLGEEFTVLLSEAVPGGAGSHAYVGVPPGEVERGRRITISVQRTGFTQTLDLVDGGLDPVAVRAASGDRIQLTAVDSAGRSFVATSIVPSSRPPKVVRTSPPRGKTFVPLNSLVEVVFSEPMNSASFTAESFSVAAGEVALTGTIALVDDGLVARFTPASQLQAGASYTVRVTTAVKDLGGEPLDTALVFHFSTVLPPPPVTSIQVDPEGVAIPFGSSKPITALTFVKETRVLGRAVRWTSVHPEIATVDSTGLVTAVAPGTAAIRARPIQADTNFYAEARVTVLPSEQLSFATVAAGAGFSCGLTTTGKSYCWGRQEAFNLGTSNTTAVAPVEIRGAPAFTTLGVGAGHACGLTNTGAVFCWGQADANQLGQPGPFGSKTCGYWPWTERWSDAWTGIAGPCEPIPLAVQGLPALVSLTVGGGHACGLEANGTAWCWGADEDGQRGAGFIAHRFPPTRVTGGRTYARIVAGWWDTCALTAEGKAWCWGFSYRIEGQLRGPVEVARELTFTTLAVSGDFGCGVVQDGSTVCWGGWVQGPGGLGVLAGAGGQKFTALAGGPYHMCGFEADGTAFCWGSNWSGQLGASAAITEGFQRTPQKVDEALRFASISPGSDHTCGRTVAGALYCWGYNYGALGNGSYPSQQTPARVLGQP